MQLFHTLYEKQGDSVIISEERVVHQLKNVLRAKPGYEFNVQYTNTNVSKRIHCVLHNFTDGTVSARILSQEEQNVLDNNKYLIVAYPNKIEKMEMIVQKCTEIGLQHIVFFPSQYSQVREISINKQERLGKIALEAVEQSYGRKLPQIIFCDNITSYLHESKIFIMHQDGVSISDNVFCSDMSSLTVLIGPEGGRGEYDMKIFSSYESQYISLGKTILRTETAAVVTAWELVS